MRLGAQRAFYFTSLAGWYDAFSMEFLAAITVTQRHFANITKINRSCAAVSAQSAQIISNSLITIELK